MLELASMTADTLSIIPKEPNQEIISNLKRNLLSSDITQIKNALDETKKSQSLKYGEKMDIILSFFDNNSNEAISYYGEACSTIKNIIYDNPATDKTNTQIIKQMFEKIDNHLDQLFANNGEYAAHHLYSDILGNFPSVIPEIYNILDNYTSKASLYYQKTLFNKIGESNSLSLYTKLLNDHPNWNTTLMINSLFESIKSPQFNKSIDEKYLELLEVIEQKADFFEKNGHEFVLTQSLSKINSTDENVMKKQQKIISKFDTLSPKNIPDILKPDSNIQEIEIIEHYSKWFLCWGAESKLLESMAKNTTILINNSFLLKFIGKPSALCIKTFTHNDHTFIEGKWYSPCDKQIRDTIKDAYNQGFAKINITNSKQWVVMRGLWPFEGISPDTLLYTAKTYANSLPEKRSIVTKLPDH